MPPSLAGKVAIITGAASGIGLATAQAFLAAGVEGLALVDLSLAALHAACPANSNKVLLLEGDVSDEASVISYVERTVARFGRLDISVQNAGIAQAPVSIMEQSVDEWDKMQRINVRGSFLGVKHSLKAMLASPDGGKGASIVLVSSQLGLDAAPELAAYCTSKFAVRGLMLSAAAEAGPKGVRVNAICPGPVVTPMMDKVPKDQWPAFAGKAMLGRLGQPEEIANGILFLASDEAAYVCGTSLKVDGGWSRWG